MSRAKAKSAASLGSGAERTSRQPSPAAAAMRGPSTATLTELRGTPQWSHSAAQWRAAAAEKYLTGKPATDENFRAAAEAEMNAAKPLEHNKFKVELGKRAIVHALRRAAKVKTA